jgi:hypothetical protein
MSTITTDLRPDLLVAALDDQATALHADVRVRREAITAAHAALAALPLPTASTTPAPSEISAAYATAQTLVRNLSSILAQVRKDTLLEASRTVADLR